MTMTMTITNSRYRCLKSDLNSSFMLKWLDYKNYLKKTSIWDIHLVTTKHVRQVTQFERLACMIMWVPKNRINKGNPTEMGLGNSMSDPLAFFFVFLFLFLQDHFWSLQFGRQKINLKFELIDFFLLGEAIYQWRRSHQSLKNSDIQYSVQAGYK